MRTILITGTPGTGKTTLARMLGERYGMPVYNVHDLASRSGNVELEDGIECIDEDIVDSLVAEEPCIFEGHMSHYASPGGRVCIVCVADLPVLKARLESRGYDGGKVRENLDAEIFRVCEMEARGLGHTVRVYAGDIDELVAWLDEQ